MVLQKTAYLQDLLIISTKFFHVIINPKISLLYLANYGVSILYHVIANSGSNNPKFPAMSFEIEDKNPKATLRMFY